MEFGFSDEQQEIQRTAREFLADRFRPEKVRELAESDNLRGRDLEGDVRAGVARDRHRRGPRWPGLGLVELVILLEQSGYALAPAALISNAFAGAVIAEAGSDEQKQRWLPGIASGEERGAAEFTNEPGPLVGRPGRLGPGACGR